MIWEARLSAFFLIITFLYLVISDIILFQLGKTCLHRGDVVAAEDLFTPIKSLPARVLERKGSTLAAATTCS